MKHFLIKIYDFLKYDLRRGVGNLIKWFPIIWKFRTWDHHYCLVVYQKALKELKEGIDKYGHYVGKEKDVRRMNICLNLLSRIIDDTELGEFSYHDMAFKNHDKKWGEMRMWFEEYDDKYCLWQSHRPNANIKKEVEQESKEYKRCLKHQRYLEEQDYELLVKMIKKYSRGWWD
jgi:hypothetical protein